MSVAFFYEHVRRPWNHKTGERISNRAHYERAEELAYAEEQARAAGLRFVWTSDAGAYHCEARRGDCVVIVRTEIHFAWGTVRSRAKRIAEAELTLATLGGEPTALAPAHYAQCVLYRAFADVATNDTEAAEVAGLLDLPPGQLRAGLRILTAVDELQTSGKPADLDRAVRVSNVFRERGIEPAQRMLEA